VTLARDLELAERAARGDEGATVELVNRALPTVRRLARRLTGDPEEGDALAQDAVLAALENIQRYRGDAAFSTWVCGIVVKRYASLQRAATTERRALGQFQRQVGSSDPERIAVSRATARDLWLLVAGLPTGYREAILAHATSDTAEDAGAKIGLTANAFRVRLHRARLALAESLRHRFPELVEVFTHAKD
jgi:RNA polymerase sigma-70 factor (ECF subfamily)